MLSDELCRTAGIAADALPAIEVAIRGRADPLIVRTVANAAMLASMIDSRPSAARAGTEPLPEAASEPGSTMLEPARVPPA